MSHHTPLKAVALVGATGTGKSALALQVAKAHDACLISCDSMQVYRHLDIGTAKPSPMEQAQVRHALIDCTDISHIWNAKTWADAAKSIIQAENDQGKVPVIVGGTGMYLKALTHGFVDIPPEKPELRARFEALQHKHGTPYLHQLLSRVDEELAARLKQGDTQRIIRGLCVYESTGKPLSAWHKQQDEVSAKARASLDCPTFVLEVPVDTLRSRIADRFMRMMDMGWLDEVHWLQQQGLPQTHPVMRAVGYRQLLAYAQGECTLDEAIKNGITATRRFAKRQRTWFRNQTPDAMRGDAKALLNPLDKAVSTYFSS